MPAGRRRDAETDDVRRAPDYPGGRHLAVPPEPAAEPAPASIPLGRDRRTDAGGGFCDGMRSIVWLGKINYKKLKRSHGHKLDTWRRIECISFSLTLLLRHASSYEDDRPVRLHADGTLSVDELLRFFIIYAFRTTRSDFEELRRLGRSAEKKRFVFLDNDRAS